MRRLGVLLVFVLLAAACGNDQDPTVAPAGTTTTTVVGQAPGATPPPATAADGGAVVAPPDTATTAPTHAAAKDPPNAKGAPGSFAAAFLQPATGERIVVEVASQDGAEPRQDTLQHVSAVLGQTSGKEVSLAGGGTPPANDQWTGDSLRAAVDVVAATPQGDGTVVLRLLFVHGHWAEDSTVLGVSFEAAAAAIFVDDVRAAADPLVGAGAIEVATTTHEVGHLLGLVDLSLHTGREDPEHPGHSTNRGSVMYWAVESSLVTDLLTGGPPRDFDDADRADLAAIRAG